MFTRSSAPDGRRASPSVSMKFCRLRRMQRPSLQILMLTLAFAEITNRMRAA